MPDGFEFDPADPDAVRRGLVDEYRRAEKLIASGRDREAIAVVRRLAASRDPGALTALASMLEKGIGVTPDLQEARQLYERAAQRGFVRAQYRLGRLLVRRGQLEDNTRWLLVAGRSGYAPAYFILGGARLANHIAGESATHWFELGAQLDHGPSLVMLGKLALQHRSLGAALKRLFQAQRAQVKYVWRHRGKLDDMDSRMLGLSSYR